MNNQYLWISLAPLFILYIYTSTRLTRKIGVEKSLSTKQRRFHIIMIWLFPWVWMKLFKSIIFAKMDVITRNRRQAMLNKERGGFYESGIAKQSI